MLVMAEREGADGNLFRGVVPASRCTAFVPLFMATSVAQNSGNTAFTKRARLATELGVNLTKWVLGSPTNRIRTILQCPAGILVTVRRYVYHTLTASSGTFWWPPSGGLSMSLCHISLQDAVNGCICWSRADCFNYHGTGTISQSIVLCMVASFGPGQVVLIGLGLIT